MSAGLKDRCVRTASRRPAAKRLLGRALILSVLVLAAAPAGVAWGALAITSPTSGSATNDRSPAFRGTTTDHGEEILEFGDPIKVKIYSGAVAEGAPIAELKSAPYPPGEWALGPVSPPLPEGVYTAKAVQINESPLGGIEESAPTTFTIDTTPPQISLNSPANGSSTASEAQLFSGSAGTAPGDLPAVTIQLFSGSAVAGPLVQQLTVQASQGSWSGAVGGLRPGTYTAEAAQSDEAGNTGSTAPVTFTVTSPPPPSPAAAPVASFRWFPANPTVAQSVALVSSSTDLASPISAYAWDLTGGGPFKSAGPVVTTSFSSPGAHVVRLRVTDSRGLSNVASATIQVARSPLTLMQPFPIVRIAGTETSSGVNISLLSVQSPIGARVTVSCRGRGCKQRAQSRLARPGKSKVHSSSVVLSFNRFQRSLRAGVVLEIRVSKLGEIGKYTRFAIHRRRLPTRFDACLPSIDPKPITCPA